MGKDLDIINRIGNGDNEAYAAVYKAYFNMIRYLVENNQGNEEDARDVFHDSVIVLIEKSRKPGFELSASLKTFIYSIARNIWYSRARKSKKITSLNDYEEYVEFEGSQIEDKKLTEHQLTIIETCLEKLGDPCKTLLRQYYYLKKSMSEIADNLGYSNADHAKSQKYKCMRRLKKMALNEA